MNPQIENDLLRVAILQYDIHWLSPEQNFIKIGTLLQGRLNQPKEKTDLLLLPETFATGFAVDCDVAESIEGPIFEFLRRCASQYQCVVAGSVLVKHQTKQVNRMYWVKPDGSYDYYDKRHLFCLGNEADYVHTGTQRKVLEINGFNVLPQICYDLRFPVFQRNQGDYDVMINIANWPAARRKAWDTLLTARAIENQCYVLGCNRIGEDDHGIKHNGGTSVYNFKGEQIATCQDDTQEVLLITLHKEPLIEFNHAFPAHLDADKFTLDLLD